VSALWNGPERLDELRCLGKRNDYGLYGWDKATYC
jgi:hypothetical protein